MHRKEQESRPEAKLGKQPRRAPAERAEGAHRGRARPARHLQHPSLAWVGLLQIRPAITLVVCNRGALAFAMWDAEVASGQARRTVGLPADSGLLGPQSWPTPNSSHVLCTYIHGAGAHAWRARKGHQPGVHEAAYRSFWVPQKLLVPPKSTTVPALLSGSVLAQTTHAPDVHLSYCMIRWDQMGY